MASQPAAGQRLHWGKCGDVLKTTSRRSTGRLDEESGGFERLWSRWTQFVEGPNIFYLCIKGRSQREKISSWCEFKKSTECFILLFSDFLLSYIKKNLIFVIFCLAAAERAARPNENKLGKQGRFNLFFIPVMSLRSVAIFPLLSLSVHRRRCGPITVKFNWHERILPAVFRKEGPTLAFSQRSEGGRRAETFAACQKRFPSTFFPLNLSYFIFGCCHEKAASLHHAAMKWKVRMNKSDFHKVEKLPLAAVQDPMWCN